MAAGDLTSVEKVRQFLQKPAADTNQDTLIADLITRASRVLQRRFGREWATTLSPNPGTRSFTYRGGGVVSLGPYEVRAVTGVSYDAQGDSPTTLSSGDWFLRPVESQDGVYSSLYLPDYIRDNTMGGAFPDRVVSVTGTWGWASVPADVEHACIVTVATWLRRDVQAFSSTFSIDEGRLERPEAIPASVARTHDYYRVPVIA